MDRLSPAYYLALCRQIAARLGNAEVITLPDAQAGARFEIRRDGHTLLQIWQTDGHLQIRTGPNRRASALTAPSVSEAIAPDPLPDLIAWMRDDTETNT
jgi:hypothetical protein